MDWKRVNGLLESIKAEAAQSETYPVFKRGQKVKVVRNRPTSPGQTVLKLGTVMTVYTSKDNQFVPSIEVRHGDMVYNRPKSFFDPVS